MKNVNFNEQLDGLFLLGEMVTNGSSIYMTSIIWMGSVCCGVLVIISLNPVVSVLFLIGLFASVSVYFIYIGLGFLGLVYLVVYIGAISILFLFILMLLNIRMSELQNNTLNAISLAIGIIIAFNICLYIILPYDITSTFIHFCWAISDKLLNVKSNPENFLKWFMDNQGWIFVSGNKWDGNLAAISHITSIGSIMYTNYNMWLFIASFILLLAMVGCIVITVKRFGLKGLDLTFWAYVLWLQAPLRISRIKKYILKCTGGVAATGTGGAGGAGGAGGGGGNNDKFLQDAKEGLSTADREAALCQAESERLASQGNASAAAEAAQDAQEWVEQAGTHLAELAWYYASNGGTG